MTVKSLDAYRTHRRSLKGARILLVDDEATVRMIIQQFLENAGFTVTVATSGEEALHRLNKKPFDLILLDIVMPDMEGLAVLKTLRQKYSMSQLPVIMVTVKEESADVVEALSLGANDYIVKPIDFIVLRARIDMHLSHQRAENELREAHDVLEHRVEERTAELLATNKALMSEITERKQAEENLRESRNFLSSIIEGAPDFIFAKDLNYRHTMVNGAFASLLGKSEEEIIGKTNSDLFSPDDAKVLNLEDREVLKSGKTHRYETPMEIDGSTRILLTTKYIHFDSAGNPAGILGISHDITDRKMAEEKIRHLAYHDELTGLPTLRLGRDRLSSAITLARRNKTSAAILYVDLDGFKEINDSKGHKAGDQVLNEVAERLIHTVRETDTVARVGGDEFVIVLTELTEEAAYIKVAEKLIKILTRPIGINGQGVNISASIGIALYPDHGDIPDELIDKADEAMYVVKNEGKNNYSIA